MPARYHKVSSWDRALRGASRSAQALAAYVWTCRHRHTEGLYELPLAYVEVDVGMDADEALQAFEELHQLRLASYDAAAEVVLDRRALRDDPIVNGTHPKTGEPTVNNRLKGAVPRVLEVPSSPLLRELYLVAVEHSPDFAEALGLARPDLTFPTEAAPEPPASPSEGASEGPPEGASKGGVVQVLCRDGEGGEATTGNTIPPCQHCTDPWEARPALQLEDGTPLLEAGRPWCGECEPQAEPVGRRTG